MRNEFEMSNNGVSACEYMEQCHCNCAQRPNGGTVSILRCTSAHVILLGHGCGNATHARSVPRQVGRPFVPVVARISLGGRSTSASRNFKTQQPPKEYGVPPALHA